MYYLVYGFGEGGSVSNATWEADRTTYIFMFYKSLCSRSSSSRGEGCIELQCIGYCFLVPSPACLPFQLTNQLLHLHRYTTQTLLSYCRYFAIITISCFGKVTEECTFRVKKSISILRGDSTSPHRPVENTTFWVGIYFGVGVKCFFL